MTVSGQNNTFSFEHQFHFFVYFYPEVVSYKVDNISIKKDSGEPDGKNICWGSYNLSVAYKKKRVQDDESCQVKCFNKSFCFYPGGDEAEKIDWNMLDYSADVKFKIKLSPWFHSFPVFKVIPCKVICTLALTINATYIELSDSRLVCGETPSIHNIEELEDCRQVPGQCPQCQCEHEIIEEAVEEEVEEAVEENQFDVVEQQKFQQERDLIAEQKNRQQKQKRRTPDLEYYRKYQFIYKQLQKHYGNQPGFRK